MGDPDAPLEESSARACTPFTWPREGQKGRHFVVFHVGRKPGCEVIEVQRLLHDSSLQRHLPSDDEPN